MTKAAPSSTFVQVQNILMVATGLGLFIFGAVLVQYGTYQASTIQWECFAGRCATNDLAGGAPVLGLLAMSLGAVFLIPTLRSFVTPVVVLTGSLAAMVGWARAISAGLVSAESVRVWMIVTTVLAALGLIWLVRVAIRELRRSRFYYSLLGRASTWGRVTDYENIDGNRCYGTLAFDDEKGTRHTIVRTEVPRKAFAYPPRVCYDPANPTDPSTLRIVMPRRPLTPALCNARLAEVRARLPLPSDR